MFYVTYTYCSVHGSDPAFLDLQDNSTGEFLLPKHFTFLGQVEVYTISYIHVHKGVYFTREDLKA